MNPPPATTAEPTDLATSRPPSSPGDKHPNHRQWYPGWTMLGVAAAAQYMSAPGQSYSVSAFKDPMQQGLSVSETAFSLCYAVATILSAVLLPYVGRIVDRLGARVTLPVIAGGLGAGCMLMSKVSSLPELYVAFCIVRSLGQGALSLISVWLVGEWFEKRRGIATAIAGLGGGLSVMTIPVLNNWLIENYGWNTAWVVLGFAVWGLLILPGIILVRDRPEDIGLHPDGFDSPDGSTDAPETSEEEARPAIAPTGESWTVAEVLRDKTFWKLLSVPSTAGLVGTGLVFHQVSLMADHGLERYEALGLMSIQAGFAALMTFPIGWITDRLESRFLLFAAMMALGGSTFLVLTLPAKWLAIVFALLLGFHGSILRSTGNVVWINFYGRAHQGAVRGVAWSAMILASAAGPLPLALSIDHFGSYRPALLLFMTLPLCAGIAVWTARMPSRQQADSM